MESLKKYWARMKEYQSIFGFPVEDMDDFIKTFVWSEGEKVRAGGVIWEVDDVGILSIDNARAERLQCNAHFVFWDRKLRGREKLVREMCRYSFKELGIRRLQVEIPLHSMPVVKFVERVGFQKEGRLRDYSWYNGEWWDNFLFSLLRGDLADAV